MGIPLSAAVLPNTRELFVGYYSLRVWLPFSSMLLLLCCIVLLQWLWISTKQLLPLSCGLPIFEMVSKLVQTFLQPCSHWRCSPLDFPLSSIVMTSVLFCVLSGFYGIPVYLARSLFLRGLDLTHGLLIHRFPILFDVFS